MKSLFIFNFILILYSFTLQGQTNKIGFETGLNNSSFFETISYGSSNIKHFTKKQFSGELIEPYINYSYSFGLTYEKYFLKEKLVLFSKINFADKSIKIHYKDENYINKITNYYLSFPIGLGIKVIKWIYWKNGLSYNLLLHSDLVENNSTLSLFCELSFNFFKNKFGINSYLNIDLTDSNIPYALNDVSSIVYTHFYYNFGITLNYKFLPKK